MRLSTEIIVSEDRIARRVREMADAIAADTAEGRALSVIALLDGAFMFCADLVRSLPMPIHLALVPMVSVARGGNPARLSLPLDFPVEGAELLLVEDILDTGRTLLSLREHLERRGPASLRIAVLLDKPAGRAVDLVPDYRGFTIPNRWVVGYGLDWQGLYRNLPYVSCVE